MSKIEAVSFCDAKIWSVIIGFHSQFSLFILRGGQFVVCIDYLDAAAVFGILDEMRATKECSWTEDGGDNEDVDDKDHNEEEDTE